ncbi:MAG: PKD domain-containing protein, partial [Bacteroidota bacterium]
MSSLFTLLLTLTSIYTSQAPTATATINCTMMVDAGPDVLICDDSQSVMLEGMVSETPIGIQWEPADLLDDPTILTPTATVTETTAFTLSVESFSTENLIFNGDFSQGDTGFTSDYEYGTGGNFGTLSQEGQYAIDDNADDTHNGFANCPDHTGGGLMMVVNASGQPNNVWCQTVTVSPDSDYAFSAWVTSVVSQNPALLRFEINGVQIGDVINPTSAICNWQQFFAVWNSGSATTAEICLSNVNLDPGGNDFALDDIAFNPLCVTTDEVVVEVANLNAEWTSPGIICYNENTIVLDDLLATDATPGGTWTINGTPATELNAADFASPSMLQVEYALENGNCVESNTQNITIALEPEADFSADQTQACIGETITLTYQGNMGLSATYNWDFDGLTATPGTGQGPQEVSTATPGTYTIRLTVEQNGCLSQEVTQTIEFVAPSITSLDVSCVATENSVEFQWPTNPDITAFIPGIISGQTTGVSTSPTSYLVTGLTPGEVVNIQILAFFANGPCSVGTFTASCTAIDCPSVTATLGTIDPICAGTPATIELSITGDAGPFDIVYELDGLANTVMGAGALTDIALNPTQTASFAITSIVNTNAPDCSIDLPAAVAIQVDQPLVAGTAQAIDPICENDGSATFDLNGLLDGADVGGQWLEISASTGSAFDATAGTF